MNDFAKITSPDDPLLEQLCVDLISLSEKKGETWPDEQLGRCGRQGVYAWFVPRHLGGQEWSEQDIVKGYIRLSSCCLTTTFVITQRMGAVRRIAASANEWLRTELLDNLVSGATFSTVGISHLTTSRQHLAKPVLRAVRDSTGFILDGYVPWVTGATHADTVVVGAALEDGQQILVAVPTNLLGLTIPAPQPLVALTGSETGTMLFDSVRVHERWLVAAPAFDIMQTGRGAQTGGLQTSALAVGLSNAALSFLMKEAEQRSDLSDAATNLAAELKALTGDLLAASSGDGSCSAQDIRTRANSLVLRTTQAALVAAKGNGFVAGHPAGRWCREALFFLVWSCPQPVATANLCELAGVVTY
jgi:alkylation response protein AidB-like acyl-CoA dehydrogenase